MTAKRKRGEEVTSLEGLRDVRPVWEHEIEHVRHVMCSEAAAGYRFAILPSAGRVHRLYANLNLTSRLFARLYNGPRENRPTPQPQTSILHEQPTPQTGGANVICAQSLTPVLVAPQKPQKRRRNRSKTPEQVKAMEAVAALAGDMGAKKIQKVLESQGFDIPMSTVKRYMREARR